MECNDLIKILIGGYIAMAGAFIWIVRVGRKDVIRLIKAFEKNTAIMEKVEKLLTNWRGH